MKTRSGFISNSSSTSFVIDASRYPDTFALATEMIKARGWEDDKDLVQRLRSARNQGMDPDTPVSFNTVNYHTYIVKYGGYYIVETSHNYAWYEMLEGIQYNMPQSVLDFLGDRWDCEMLCFDTITDFWYPKIGVLGKTHRVNSRRDNRDGFGITQYCDKCRADMVMEKDSGRVRCSEGCKDDN